MKFNIRIALNATPEQALRLLALQQAFAEVCNAISPMVQQSRIWNRVALHHMAYKPMRERFPALGSQMVCNAIYSVSRSARAVFQAPGSPFRLQRLGDRPLPKLHFENSAPVYFDRHTLSLKEGQLSMYTLDGRMRFKLDLAPEVGQRFHHDKLREIVLARVGPDFELRFRFDAPGDGEPAALEDPDWPEYLVLLSENAAEPPAAIGRPAATPPPQKEATP